MKKFYRGVVKFRKSILIFFLICAVFCAFLKNLVAVNYDMNDYLPEDAEEVESEEEESAGVWQKLVNLFDR